MDHEGRHRFPAVGAPGRRTAAPQLHIQNRADAEPGRRHQWQLPLLAGRRRSQPPVVESEQAADADHLSPQGHDSALWARVSMTE